MSARPALAFTRQTGDAVVTNGVYLGRLTPHRKRLPALVIGALVLAVGLAAYCGVNHLVRRDS